MNRIILAASLVLLAAAPAGAQTTVGSFTGTISGTGCVASVQVITLSSDRRSAALRYAVRVTGSTDPVRLDMGLSLTSGGRTERGALAAVWRGTGTFTDTFRFERPVPDAGPITASFSGTCARAGSMGGSF